MAQLQSALGEETNAHTQTNCTLMADNMKLIEEINKQRAANNLLKQAVQAHVGRVRHIAQAQHEASVKAAREGARSAGPHRTRGSTAEQAVKSGIYQPRPPGTAPGGMDRSSVSGGMEMDPLLQLDKNRFRIAALKGAIQELESRVGMQKAYSREVFPPMDGVRAMPGAGGEDSGLVPTQPETQPASSSRGGSRRGSRNFVEGIAAIPSIAAAAGASREPPLTAREEPESDSAAVNNVIDDDQEQLLV